MDDDSSRKLLGDFTIGTLCLIVGIGLIGFSIYLLPYLIMGLHYRVPTFIVSIQHYLTLHHGIIGWLQIGIVLLPIVLAGCMFLYLAREYTLTIDDEEKQEKAAADVSTRKFYRRRYKVHPLVEILALILLVLVLLLFVQWLLGIPW